MELPVLEWGIDVAGVLCASFLVSNHVRILILRVILKQSQGVEDLASTRPIGIPEKHRERAAAMSYDDPGAMNFITVTSGWIV